MGRYPFSGPLEAAGFGGNIKVIDYLFARNPEVAERDWYRCFIGACGGGHLNIVAMFIALFPNGILDQFRNSYPLYAAFSGRHREIITLLLKQGFQFDSCCWEIACESGDCEFIQWVMATIDYRFDWRVGLVAACHLPSLAATKLLLPHLTGDSEFDDVFIELIYHDEEGIALVELLLEHGAKVNEKVIQQCYENSTTATSSYLLDRIHRCHQKSRSS